MQSSVYTAKRPLKEQFVRLFVSLYVPYLFYNFFYWLERAVASATLQVSFEEPLETSVGEIIALFYSGKGLSWFFLALFVVKFSYAILCRFISDKEIFFIYLMMLIYFEFASECADGIYYLSWGVFYITGRLLVKKKEEMRTGIIFRMALILGLLIGVYLGNIYGVGMFCKFFVGIPASYIIITISERKVPVALPLLNLCGKNSVTILMIHGWIQGLVLMILTAFSFGTENWVVLAITMTLIQVLAGLLCVWIYKKITWMKWIRFLFEPHYFLKK